MIFNTAIIDYDPLVWRCGKAIEYKNEAGETVSEPAKHGFYNINSMMRKIFRATNCKEYFAYMSPNDRSNFRFQIFPEYKINRKDVLKPIYYMELREFGQRRWEVIETTGQEADDACSIHHCKLNNLGWDEEIKNSIICSIDKDFNNVPGWHFNYVTGEIYYVSEICALRNFYLQVLTGDTADGIPRIKKGWRQKNAEEKIKAALTEEELLSIVRYEIKLNMNEFQEMTEDVLVKRGQLLWLRRKENELWQPPR